ncbi:GTPase HflX [soil metagenome]
MIELEEPRERAILVGAPLKSVAPELTEEHIEELGRLVDTAGADIVGSLTQRLDSPHPRFRVGEGKAEELRDLAASTEATLIVFDEELSPAQGKNLEQFTGVRIMDRAELILDIFATRARTAEAKMQVELAQLQYLLPRLARMWTHLSRVRGGIGMRGPGETQIETDRRMINHRISRLKDDLQRVATQRATQRKGREDLLKAALVGYTNAGKSSVLRAISDTEVLVEDRLFATLDAATRQVDLGEGEQALITDTVGFIRKLPHHLVASFRATLEEAQEADLLLHVIDLSHSGWEEQKEVVDQVLAGLGLRERETILVFNKVDRLTHDEEKAWRDRAAANYPSESVFTSTVEPGGVEPLRDRLRMRGQAAKPQVDIELAFSEGAVLAEIYRDAEVLARDDDEEHIRLRVRMSPAVLGRIRRAPGVVIRDAR